MNKKTQGKEMSRVVAKCNPAEPIELSDEAMDKVRVKIRSALAPRTPQDSVKTTILGFKRRIRGWCQYDP